MGLLHKLQFWLHWKHDLNAHVFALLHQFSINDDLVRANPIPDRVSGIPGSRDLDLVPFFVGWHQTAGQSTLLELFVDTLIFDASLTLNQGGSWQNQLGPTLQQAALTYQKRVSSAGCPSSC